MLNSLNRMTGLPAVWRDRRMGYVERAVADVRGSRLHGLVIRRGIGSARWCPGEGILLAGRQCVILADQPVRMPEKEPCPVDSAVSSSGGYAGEISDVIFRGDTLEIAALEIVQGPLYRLLGQCAYAPAWQVREGEAKAEAVVPLLLSWTQLCTQLGEGDDR